MSLYGPAVQNQPFTGLGDAISGGLQEFLQAKQLQREKDLQAYQTGFGAQVVDPNAPAATPSTGPGGLQGALQTGIGRLFGRSPAPTAPPPTAMPTPAVSNTDHVRAALSAVGNGTVSLPGQTVQPQGAPPMSIMGTTGQNPSVSGAPTGDLGAALQSGQASQLNRAGGGQSTPQGMDPNTMVRLPSGQIVPLGQTTFGRQMQAAQVENLVKRADVQKSLSSANEQDALANLHGLEGDPQFLKKKAEAEADGKLADELFLQVQKNGMDYESAAKLAKLHGGIASQLLDQRLSGEAANQAANQQPYDFVQGTDPATEKPIVYKGNKKTGDLEPTSAGGKATTGGSGLADRTRAQLETAAGQADLADKGMTAYEEKVLSGKANLNPLAVSLARAAIGGSTTAEATLNTLNPELASYVRFSKQVATAERMITPRGGSNSTTQAEALLSGAGASGTPEQIQNARQYRAALIHGLRGGGSPTSSAPATSSQAQQLWDAAVQLHGQAKVEQEYGPRPSQ